MGRCKRDTTDIMIASSEMIVICNVKPYERGLGYGEGEGGGKKVLSFKKILRAFVLKINLLLELALSIPWM